MIIRPELLEVDKIRTVVVDQSIESKSGLPAGREIVNLNMPAKKQGIKNVFHLPKKERQSLTIW